MGIDRMHLELEAAEAADRENRLTVAARLKELPDNQKVYLIGLIAETVEHGHHLTPKDILVLVKRATERIVAEAEENKADI